MFEGILEDREKRYENTLFLLEKYKKPVICGKINYPGDNKNTPEVYSAFHILRKLLEDNFSERAEYMGTLAGQDGPSFSMVLDMEGLAAKAHAARLEEETPLGRIFDIDIYVDEGRSIGREEIGLSPRKCIICGENARSCNRERRHTAEEVRRKMDNLIRKYGDNK